LITLYFAQNVYRFKIASTAIKTLEAMIGGGQAAGRAGIQPETDAALESFKALRVPLHVLMVPQRGEIGWFGTRVDSRAADSVLKSHDIAYSWCRLTGSDFMPNDGHPNGIGYDKLAACADDFLRAMK
jgi:hypothetical protein